MIFEYTLLTTLAFHHIVIGVMLIAGLLLMNKALISNAEIRSWLWMTVFVLSTVVPFTLISRDTEAVVAVSNASRTVASLDIAAESFEIQKQAPEPVTQSWHLPTELVFNFSLFLTIGLILWAIGSLWRAFTTLNTLLRTRQLIASNLEPMQSLSSEVGTLVYSSSAVASPLVIGLRKPKIILPESIVQQLGSDQVTAIVLHEKAHINRKDNWFGLFQELIAILFWWSPVIRFVNRRIHLEREIACDLRAAIQLEDSKHYAQSLLDCAKLMVNEQRNVLAMGLFTRKKELNYRVGAVLQNKAAGIPSRLLIAIGCIAVGASTVQAAQTFSPRISIQHTAKDARIFSVLSRQESERLIEAVARDDLPEIEALLAGGTDINIPVIGDGTALMIAVKRRNLSMVRALIDLGADVNQASMFDGNPLIVAAKTGDITIAELLILNGADVNGIVPRDETPLINASKFGHIEMTKLLVERGANVNLAVRTGLEDGYENRSPLNMASGRDIRDYLLANGAIE